MKDLLKKGFYTGLGAGLLLKDEIMKVLDAPIKVNDVPGEEMKRNLREMLHGLSGKLALRVNGAKEAGEEELTALLGRIGLARAEDVQGLKERIAELEKKLDEKKGD
jgi:polyhydroxyalkanoate synthesis regulator phasin